MLGTLVVVSVSYELATTTTATAKKRQLSAKMINVNRFGHGRGVRPRKTWTSRRKRGLSGPAVDRSGPPPETLLMFRRRDSAPPQPRPVAGSDCEKIKAQVEQPVADVLPHGLRRRSTNV